MLPKFNNINLATEKQSHSATKKHDSDVHEIVQPTLDYNLRLLMAKKSGIRTPLSVQDFKKQSEQEMEKVAAMTNVGTHIHSPCLPIYLPSLDGKPFKQLVEELLAGVGNSFKRYCGGKFDNRLSGTLERLLLMDDEDPSWEIITALKTQSLVSLYFPIPLSLQALPVQAQRYVIKGLPDGFTGSGLLEAAMGLIMYPDILVSDSISTGYCCPAASWFIKEYAPYFRRIHDTIFLDHVEVTAAFKDYSGGVSFTKLKK